MDPPQARPTLGDQPDYRSSHGPPAQVQDLTPKGGRIHRGLAVQGDCARRSVAILADSQCIRVRPVPRPPRGRQVPHPCHKRYQCRTLPELRIASSMCLAI